MHKKPVKRVILLEEALADLMEAEYILATLETRDVFHAFTTKHSKAIGMCSPDCAT